MNNLKNISLLIVLLTVFSVSCDSIKFDTLDNPNAASLESAQPDDVFNSIQLAFISFVGNTDFFATPLSRMTALTGGQKYNNSFQPSNYNGIWLNAYAQIFPDVDLMQSITEGNNLRIHYGASLVMKAYVMITLVDVFGDVPYSEIGQGLANLNPAADKGADVYKEAVEVLDNAITLLTEGDEDTSPAFDNFYGGNASNWIRAANTIKLKIYLNQRLVDEATSKTEIDKIIAADNYISESSHDFQFQFSTNRQNPNSRHPYYNAQYETLDGPYMNNYFMWLMVGEKSNIDPRTRFYFYRQDLDLSNESVNVWGCSLDGTGRPPVLFPDQPTPDHIVDLQNANSGYPFCITTTNGYFGRDHGNASGIPPDGGVRTTFGLYPGGGLFDDNSAVNTKQDGTLGAKGEGMWPILLSSYTHFMLAEAAETIGVTGSAKTYLQTAVEHSMDKVFSFQSLIPNINQNLATDIEGTSLTLKAAYLDNLSNEKSSYLTEVGNLYDASSDKLDVISKEFLIAAFGNGMEGYNLYRRTGKPNNIQPHLDPNEGGEQFMRSAFYPLDYVSRNSNATQKADVTTPVFWDNNEASIFK